MTQPPKTSEHLKLVRDAHYKTNWTRRHNYLCVISQGISGEKYCYYSPVAQILENQIGYSGAHVFFPEILPEEEYELPDLSDDEFDLLYPFIGFKANLARFIWLSLMITKYESKGD